MAKKISQNNNDSNKPKSSLLSAISINSGICLLIVAGCFIYLGLFTLPAVNNTSIVTQAQTLADSQVSLIDQALTQLRVRLSHIAHSKELLHALQVQDKPLVDKYQQELIRSFPEAEAVRIITLGPLGIATLNKKNKQLHSNIELDLIRHVSNGSNVEPEAYKRQGQWLFSLAEAVKSPDKKHADGALLVTLNEKYLRMLLSQLDSSLGNTQLFQQFKSKQHLLASTGSSDNNHLTTNADTSISHWHLRFTPSQELITASSQSTLLIWIFLGGSIFILVIMAIFLYHSLKSTLIKETNSIANNTSTGKITSYSLPGFDALALNLKTLFEEKQKKATQASTNKAKIETNSTNTPAPEIEPAAKKAESPNKTIETTTQVSLPTDIPATIFRAYDIRGLAKEQLNNDIVFAIGLAIGSEALDQGQQSIVVSADGRHSSPQIRDALVKGLLASGRDVIDIGTMPTPLMYFATHQLGTQSGAMITGSHNPAEYNGIKIVIAGKALAGTAIENLRNRIITKQLSSGQGEYRTQDVEEPYIDYIINDVAIAQPLKIVIDAGNGVAGAIAPRLFEELGCEVIPLYCDVDGHFPNHHPDPSIEENLQDLILTVKEQQADLGIAFDGDGDRVAAVSPSGIAIPADRLLMLLAQDVVSRNPGADVIFDVKCTRNLNTLISNYGGRPIMWKSGHSFMKEKMLETGALLGGEFSGHIFFKERWFGFDDGMYAAARLIEILSTTDPNLDNQISAFPESISTQEIKVVTTDEQKFETLEQLISQNSFDGGKISTLDGLRVDFPDGWGLVRVSNTTPMLTLRFEADTTQAMDRIQTLFKEQLTNVDRSLDLSF